MHKNLKKKFRGKRNPHYAMGDPQGGESRSSPLSASANSLRAQHQLREGVRTKCETPVKEKTILFVSLINASVNALLAIVKIIAGYVGFSHALIADGIHSFSDIVTDVLVFFAARASIQHPDREHPYGHQRIETIGTLVIALILVAVSISIVTDAIQHLLSRVFEIPTIPVIIVAVVSIFANEALFHYSKHQGKKINSNLLISNAWHKRSDVFVSIIVLFSVIGSRLGLTWLDSAGAIVIALLIVKIGIQMIWHSVQELIDRGVDEKTLSKIVAIVKSNPGVRSIHQLRTRLHANSIFVDLHIIVDPFISVSEGHHIGEEVHVALLKKIKNIFDVTVHIDSENDEDSRPSLHLPNRDIIKQQLKLCWENLPGFHQIEKMTLHYLSGKLYVDIVLPVDFLTHGKEADLLAQYQAAAQSIAVIERITIQYTATS